MGLIGIKYCGGCNPQINRSGLVQDVENLLPPDCRFVTDHTMNRWEMAILVCGCPTACADRPAVRSLALQWIRVAGATVDLDPVPKSDMADVIVRRIQAWKLKKKKISRVS